MQSVDSVKYIGEEHFKPDDLNTVYVGVNSCAERYCIENGLLYSYIE